MPTPNKRSADSGFVSCINCQHAKAFYQWFTNPVVALCGIHGERQVAQSRRVCKLYVPAQREQLDVRHFDHYPATKAELDAFMEQEARILHGNKS